MLKVFLATQHGIIIHINGEHENAIDYIKTIKSVFVVVLLMTIY